MSSTHKSCTVQEKYVQANGLKMFYRECWDRCAADLAAQRHGCQ